MTITVQAIYENGTLKLLEPLPLKEREKVRVTIEGGRNPVQETYGMFGWTGDHETLEYFALDPELDPQESA